MEENKFRNFKKFYSFLILVLGMSTFFSNVWVGIAMVLLGFSQYVSSKIKVLPYSYTILIHLYGIVTWFYIQDHFNSICSNTFLTRVSILLIIFEIWFMVGTLFNKYIRVTEVK